MTARPSARNERLVTWLEAIAILNGYRWPASPLAHGLRPDVLRRGPGGLCVGDGKPTSTRALATRFDG